MSKRDRNSSTGRQTHSHPSQLLQEGGEVGGGKGRSSMDREGGCPHADRILPDITSSCHLAANSNDTPPIDRKRNDCYKSHFVYTPTDIMLPCIMFICNAARAHIRPNGKNWR